MDGDGCRWMDKAASWVGMGMGVGYMCVFFLILSESRLSV